MEKYVCSYCGYESEGEFDICPKCDMNFSGSGESEVIVRGDDTNTRSTVRIAAS